MPGNPLDRFSLAGKTVAITGASSGFGHHFAGVLAEAGAAVILGARRTDKIQARVDGLRAAGHRALGAELDVLDRGSIESWLDTAWREFGAVDVLVNNAGVSGDPHLYASLPEDDWDRILDTNLKSVWLASKLYTERVAARGQAAGNIVNIASITAYRTIKGQFPYAVSKAGLVKATEVIALEGAKFGVRCNALAPGYILTDVSRILLESPKSEAFRKGIPMRRYGEFEDLDGPLLLLASDASQWMTGSTLVVDGGHLCSEL